MYCRILNKKIPKISLGTWGFAGNSYGSISIKKCHELLSNCLEHDINFFETADCYGEGRSEKILRYLNKNDRQTFIIATKVGNLPHTGFVMPQNFTKKYILKSAGESLKRLTLDYIDIYLLHSPNIINGEEVSRPLDTLLDLKRKNFVKAIGIALRSPLDLKKLSVESLKKIDYVSLNYNLYDQRFTEHNIDKITEQFGIKVICRTALCFGFLTNKINLKTKFKKNDHRSLWPKKQTELWLNSQSLFINESKEKNIGKLALNFCLSNKNIKTTCIGMLTKSDVIENSKVSSGKPIPDQYLEKFYEIYKNNNFYYKDSKK